MIERREFCGPCKSYCAERSHKPPCRLASSESRKRLVDKISGEVVTRKEQSLGRLSLSEKAQICRSSVWAEIQAPRYEGP